LVVTCVKFSIYFGSFWYEMEKKIFYESKSVCEKLLSTDTAMIDSYGPVV